MSYTKKVDKAGELEEENSYLQAKIAHLEEALGKASQPQTADKAARVEITEVIIEPALYSTLSLALRHNPAAIKLQVQDSRATGIVEAAIL